MLSTVITVSVTIPMFSVFAGVLIMVTLIMLYFYLPAATTLKKQKTETAGTCVGVTAAAVACIVQHMEWQRCCPQVCVRCNACCHCASGQLLSLCLRSAVLVVWLFLYHLPEKLSFCLLHCATR